MNMKGKLHTVEESAEKKSQDSLIREKSQKSRGSRRSNSADNSPTFVDATSPLLGKYKKLAPKEHNNMAGIDQTIRFRGLFAQPM